MVQAIIQFTVHPTDLMTQGRGRMMVRPLPEVMLRNFKFGKKNSMQMAQPHGKKNTTDANDLRHIMTPIT